MEREHLFDEPNAGRVAVVEPHVAERPVFLKEVDHTPVAETGHDQARNGRQRGLEFERRRQRRARFGQERLPIPRAPLIVDVGGHSEPSGDPPFAVPQRDAPPEEPAIGAVRPPEAEFRLERFAGRHGPLPALPYGVAVVRMEGLDPPLAQRGFRGQAGVGEEASVDVFPEAVRPRHEENFGNLLGQDAESLLAFAEALLGVATFEEASDRAAQVRGDSEQFGIGRFRPAAEDRDHPLKATGLSHGEAEGGGQAGALGERSAKKARILGNAFKPERGFLLPDAAEQDLSAAERPPAAVLQEFGERSGRFRPGVAEPQDARLGIHPPVEGQRPAQFPAERLKDRANGLLRPRRGRQNSGHDAVEKPQRRLGTIEIPPASRLQNGAADGGAERREVILVHAAGRARLEELDGMAFGHLPRDEDEGDAGAALPGQGQRFEACQGGNGMVRENDVRRLLLGERPQELLPPLHPAEDEGDSGSAEGALDEKSVFEVVLQADDPQGSPGVPRHPGCILAQGKPGDNRRLGGGGRI